MSVLLRCPASVPALFSRAVEPGEPVERPVSAWRRLLVRPAAAVTVAGAVAALIDVPLVKAATAAVALALPG